MIQEIYLDWAATALPDKKALKDYVKTANDFFGNPSSAHKSGRNAKTCLETSRSGIAKELGVKAEQIIFCSGATEANNLILNSLLLSKKTPGSLVISGFEHAAVWEPAELLARQGWKIKTVPSDTLGRLSLKKLEKSITPDTDLVSIMAVNNETGAVQPLKEAAEIIRGREKETGKPIFFHTDAVQALGKMKLDLGSWDVDAASFSGHKIGAPRGVGLLFLRKPLDTISRGGGQEQGLRNGTENLPGIAAFYRTIELWQKKLPQNLAKARELQYFLADSLESMGARFAAPKAVILSPAYSPWLLWAGFPPIPGEVLLRVLDDKQVRVATGSACSSRQKKTYRVTRGLGIPDETAFSAIRISWGPDTREEELLAFTLILRQALEELGAGGLEKKKPARGKK